MSPFGAAYVGLATVAGFIWWFVYSDNGPKLNYSELVSALLVFKFYWETDCLYLSCFSDYVREKNVMFFGM